MSQGPELRDKQDFNGLDSGSSELRFRVLLGLGCSVLGSGLRAKGLEFSVWGLGRSVSWVVLEGLGSGFQVCFGLFGSRLSMWL